MISSFLSPRSTLVTKFKDGSPGRDEGWALISHAWEFISVVTLETLLKEVLDDKEKETVCWTVNEKPEIKNKRRLEK